MIALFLIPFISQNALFSKQIRESRMLLSPGSILLSLVLVLTMVSILKNDKNKNKDDKSIKRSGMFFMVLAGASAFKDAPTQLTDYYYFWY
ncbi:MAG: hypothetical protein E7256_04505 [Lachnospiraceae bacterium]|nr:hypothetical protein [Lachnospiraceae bacterium]